MTGATGVALAHAPEMLAATVNARRIPVRMLGISLAAFVPFATFVLSRGPVRSLRGYARTSKVSSVAAATRSQSTVTPIPGPVGTGTVPSRLTSIPGSIRSGTK